MLSEALALINTKKINKNKFNLMTKLTNHNNLSSSKNLLLRHNQIKLIIKVL